MSNPKTRPPFCPKCGGTDFSDSNYCRSCHRARNKAYLLSPLGQAFKEREKPKRTVYNKTYWQITKPTVQAKADADREAGLPTEAALKAAKYKADHPDRLSESLAKFYASEKGMIYKWSNITAAHTRKRAATDLPAAFLRELWNKQGGICPLTHRTMKIAGTGYVLDAPSLDRIDPIGGYVANNVRIVTFQANSARMNGTDADLLAFCRAVLAYRDKLKR